MVDTKILQLKGMLNDSDIFEEEYLNALAKEMGFVQRSNNRLSGRDFFFNGSRAFSKCQRLVRSIK